MINYKSPEEKTVALYFAEQLKDELALEILNRGSVETSAEATHISKFFWAMIEESAKGTAKLPCEGSSQFWTEKIYNSLGGYLERVGFENEWNTEIDNA